MNAEMLRALRYVRRVGSVEAWPYEIADRTIRSLRRQGLVETTCETWNVHPSGGVYWSGHIRDRLSEKGRRALEAAS